MIFAPLPATACWRHRGARSGFEVAFFQAGPGGWRMDGTTAAAEDEQTWIVSYSIALDAAWLTREARVTARTATGLRETVLAGDGEGRWRVDGRPAAHLDGCLDVDLESSALDLSAVRLEQSYARLPDQGASQRYRYAAPAFGFTCTLIYDESGLVLDYPGIAVRAR